MIVTPMNQTFYPEEATRLFPSGCQCHDRSGSCDWCQIYYWGLEETGNLPLEEKPIVHMRSPRVVQKEKP